MNELSYTNNPLGNANFQNLPQQAEQNRAVEEVKAMVFMAKQFPRDLVSAESRILENCKRPGLAQQSIFRLPRGKDNNGRKIYVEGPSIRLAEELARNWGNMEFGTKEITSNEDETKCISYCWDLETNTRQVKEFTVKHQRKVNGKIQKVEDPAQIYELIAARASRNVRNCIISSIPSDIVEKAMTVCKQTLLSGGEVPLPDRIMKTIQLFGEKFGVTKAQLEEHIGHNSDEFTTYHLAELGVVYNSLNEGTMKVDDVFKKQDLYKEVDPLIANFKK